MAGRCGAPGRAPIYPKYGSQPETADAPSPSWPMSDRVARLAGRDQVPEGSGSDRRQDGGNLGARVGQVARFARPRRQIGTKASPRHRSIVSQGGNEFSTNEVVRSPNCDQSFLSDLPAGEGCSERAWVPGEVPVPEPLPPHGMGSGIGFFRHVRHRRAQTTSAGLRKVKSGPPQRRARGSWHGSRRRGSGGSRHAMVSSGAQPQSPAISERPGDTASPEADPNADEHPERAEPGRWFFSPHAQPDRA